MIRAALLDIAVALGDRLCRRHQITGALSLELVFADGSTVSRTRQLTEPSAHTHDLRAVLYRMVDSLGLQRARVRGITAAADRIASFGSASGQISLDSVREDRLLVEPVTDALNERFGAGTVRPATLACPRGRPARPRRPDIGGAG